MGLELKARGGRLVHVRQTGRVDEMRGAETHEVPAIEYGVLAYVKYVAPGLPTHIVPTWDIRGHALGCCPCQPRQDDEEPGVFIHNAFDGRERYVYGKAQRH